MNRALGWPHGCELSGEPLKVHADLVLQSFIQRPAKTGNISNRGKSMRGIGHSLIGLILALAALTAQPAWADGKDCPLIGTLDNFVPRDAPLWTNYAAYDFRATQGNGDVNV